MTDNEEIQYSDKYFDDQFEYRWKKQKLTRSTENKQNLFLNFLAMWFYQIK